MKLNDIKSACSVGDQTLNVNTTIDYKSASDTRTSIGKIKEFKYAGHKQCDTESVWMLIQDAESNEMEWISVAVWYEHFKLGIFTNKAPSNESIATEDLDLPF